MLKKFLKFTLQNCGPTLFLLLLISCKSNALQSVTDTDFNNLLLRAEQLNDSDPKAALLLLDAHKEELNVQPISTQVNYYRIQSTAYADQGLYSLSKTSSELGLKLAKQMNNPSIYIAELAYTKGFTLESAGDFDNAYKFYQNGLDVARSMNDKEFTAKGLINIGALFYLREDFKQSLITLNQALKLANELADDALLGNTASELGILYQYIGEDEQARDYFQQAYQHFKKAGKNNYAMHSLQNVAINHSSGERYEQAIEVYRILEKEIQPNTNNEFIASIYRSMAWALLKKEESDTENAYRYIMLAGEYVKEVEQHFVKIQYLIDKAYILVELERNQEALDILEQADAFIERKDNGLYGMSAIDIIFLKAKLHYALGQYNRAYLLQTEFFSKYQAYEQERETTEIDELRLQFESETAQRHKNILEKKQHIQNLQLEQMTLESQSRQMLQMVLAACSLILAWVLFRVIKGQKVLVKATQTDSLTGVMNRRRLLQLAQEYFLTAKESQEPFSVYMIDIDFFKKVNDQFGHRIGDNALKEMALLGQRLMRESDVFGRFGGEEFIALLPNTSGSVAVEVAQRLRQSIEQATWKTQQISKLTVSIGVATYHCGNYPDFLALLKVADEQLLKAKKSGRNKVSYND